MQQESTDSFESGRQSNVTPVRSPQSRRPLRVETIVDDKDDHRSQCGTIIDLVPIDYHEEASLQYESPLGQVIAQYQSSDLFTRWRKRFVKWCCYQHGVFYMAYYLMQLIMFSYYVGYFLNATQLIRMRQKLQPASFSLARSSAKMLNLNLAVMLLTMCKRFLGFLRKSYLLRRYVIPFNQVAQFHRINGVLISIYTLVHVCCHIFNFLRVSADSGISYAQLLFGSGVGLTGVLCTLCLILVASIGLFYRRFKWKHEVFAYSHQLYVPLNIILLFHGQFCFTKYDNGKCYPSQFWILNLVPGAIFLCEKVRAELISRLWPAYVENVTILHNEVIQLELSSPMWFTCGGNSTIQAGGYLRLNVPQISWLQWHPFTVTSAPSSSQYISVHIRPAGNFTQQFLSHIKYAQIAAQKSASEFGLIYNYRAFMPTIYFDNGYCSPAVDILNTYDVAVLIGCGIGMTPYASVLKQLLEMDMSQLRAKKIYLKWICRDFEEFQWFIDILVRVNKDERLRQVVDMKLYWTIKSTTSTLTRKFHQQWYNDRHGVKSENSIMKQLQDFMVLGRPNWGREFESLQRQHMGQVVSLYFCGPQSLADQLQRLCHEQDDHTTFLFNKEEF
ncbi:hypothetical protein MIR68_006204 [Amoeboaphelidium protococcarum]|nr:hypothetical protein MIR68_006204 [Amoeboaphelidium protococcarum]